jgi:hypothetical protein
VRLLTVDPDLNEFEGFTGGGAFLPELAARGAPEDCRLCFDRPAKSLVVDVSDEDHLACVGMLDCAGQNVTSGRSIELREIQLKS